MWMHQCKVLDRILKLNVLILYHLFLFSVAFNFAPAIWCHVWLLVGQVLVCPQQPSPTASTYSFISLSILGAFFVVILISWVEQLPRILEKEDT